MGNTQLLQKVQLLASLTPVLRSRNTTIPRPLAFAAAERKELLLKQKSELEFILRVCEDVLSA